MIFAHVHRLLGFFADQVVVQVGWEGWLGDGSIGLIRCDIWLVVGLFCLGFFLALLCFCVDWLLVLIGRVDVGPS
jgi:hypothetical protein